MNRIRLRAAILFLLIVVGSAPLLGQVATGLPPFGSFGGGPFDTVNNANLNVHFEIPIIRKAGRGMPFQYVLSYDSSLWYPVGFNGSHVWTPAPGWGWKQEGATGYLSYSQTFTSCGNQYQNSFTYSNWSYTDPSGTAHPFNLTIINNTSCPNGSVWQRYGRGRFRLRF